MQIKSFAQTDFCTRPNHRETRKKQTAPHIQLKIMYHLNSMLRKVKKLTPQDHQKIIAKLKTNKSLAHEDKILQMAEHLAANKNFHRNNFNEAELF